MRLGCAHTKSDENEKSHLHYLRGAFVRRQMALDGARLPGRDSTLHIPRSPTRKEGEGLAGWQPQMARCAPEMLPFGKPLELLVKEEERPRTTNEHARGGGTWNRRGGCLMGDGECNGDKSIGLKQSMDDIGYKILASAF
jgi:hypothetical protein